MKRINLLIGVFITICCACSKSSGGGNNTNNATVPSVKIADVTQARTKTNSIYRFYIDLNVATTQAVSVDYTTVAGTAVEGKDFTRQSGTITIPASETERYVDITVQGDSLRQSDLQFFVQLSNPANATIGTGKATGTIVNQDGTYLPTDNGGYTTPTSYTGYHLAWSDEFNGTAPDEQSWNYETGGGGWGNNELEYYTSSQKNIFLSNGNLIIEARKETMGTNNYTSARINTSNKKQFQYGRIDIRAKLPVSSGMWPALWMLGSNLSTAGWPACGETDIMELIGKNPKQIVGSIHWKQQNATEGTFNNVYNAAQDFSQQFHVFSEIWDMNSVKLLVDDQVYVTATDQNVTSGTYPFNNPFFFIFNVAVGGDWPGSPDAATVFPQRMFVDYVRVFQK